MPTLAPSATIVIPLLEQPDDWLEQAVVSALEQTVPTEVVVVHSAKTPGSNHAVLAKLQRRGPFLKVAAEPRPSFPAALNQGIRLAQAERVGFLLADDWLEPTTVEKCLEREAAIVCTGIARIDPDGDQRYTTRLITQCRFDQLATLEARARYLEHFFLFQKAKLFEVGLLDESVGDFPGIDDYHLIWTLLEEGASVEIVEEPLYNKREHDGERLTLAPVEQSRASLSKILDAHGVTGRRKRRLVFEQSQWFGQPSNAVSRRLAGRRFKRLYELWKRVVYGPLD